MDTKNWFASWFDTDYYHTLYKHRNDEEAKLFIDQLIQHLALPAQSKVLDLACGKGRHSAMLHAHQLDVLGVDLSANSISIASEMKQAGLNFEVHDMRQGIPNRSFDAIFNLFTSFGYFEDVNDNQKVLEAVHTMLAHQGTLVIDFMNATKVIENLVADEVKTVDTITFNIKRSYDGNHIFKNIQFDDQGEHFDFTERVQALKLTDFNTLLEQSGFELIRTFGDFNLNPFDEAHSDRLIMVAKKK